MAPAQNDASYIRYSGRIAYIHDTDGENGRENFTITRFPGDERTVRAICEMDKRRLLRDVTYTVSDDFRPRDCYNRVRVDGQLAGSAWFHFDENVIEVEGDITGIGRFTQRRRLPTASPYFACHPLVVDGWHAAAFDHQSQDKVQLIENATNSSMPLDGSAAPILGVVRKGLEYVGEEVLTVQAGTFKAKHFRIIPMRVEAPDWTPMDLWVHGDENIFLRIRWDMIGQTYELTELDAPKSVAQRLP